LHELSKDLHMKTRVVTTTLTAITSGLQSIIDFSNEASEEAQDFKTFRKHPQRVLLASIAEIVGKANNDKVLLQRKWNDHKNRITEYARAIHIIAANRKDAFNVEEADRTIIDQLKYPIIEFKSQREEYAQSDMKKRPDAYLWNVELMMDLLRKVVVP
jgi:hypothetical protein